MKSLIIGLLVLLVFLKTSFGQHCNISLLAGGGPSFNGTGDAGGYTIINEVDLAFGKRFFLSPGVQFTNHSQIQNLSSYEIRSITTGINLYANINYLLLNRPRHRIAFGAGPTVRRQTSSMPSEVGTTLSPAGEQLLTLKYDEPLHTLSLGYNISPAYYFQASRRFFLGGKFILQNDTRADIITSSVIFIGVVL